MPHLDEGVVVGTMEIGGAQAERVKTMDDGGQGPSVDLIAGSLRVPASRSQPL